MKQTAIEFLISKIESNSNPSLTQKELKESIEQAKEMERQQIIDACDYGIKLYINDPITSEDYYTSTYGSKGNDECREINWGGVIQKMPIETFSQTKYEQINQDNPITRGSTTLVISKPTSPQTEISDEELTKLANDQKRAWVIEGMKLYREQLKSKL